MAPVELPILPISELSSYQTRWAIRARVTTKSQLRTFSKGAGNGKVFSVELLDAQGGEIRASFFNAAADQYFEKMQKGKCFTLSRGNIKIANRQFNLCKHRYELVFDIGAQVEESADDAQIQEIKLNVTDLRSVQSKALPCVVDLCGVVTSFRPAMTFTSQAGKELVKRDIVLADDTATSMSVTLWGERAKQEDRVFEGNAVVCLKGVNVKEWNGGRSGSLLESGTLLLAPKLPEAQRVQQWWEQGGSTQSLTALSQEGGGAGAGGARGGGKQADLSEVRELAERPLEQAQFLSTVCRLALVQTKKQGEVQPLTYLACQEPKEGNGLPCNRRVDQSGFCVSCNRAGKVAPRMNLRCRFADYNDSLWLTTFHEPAQQVLGMTAEEAQALEQGGGGREALEAAIRERYFHQPLKVTMRAKMDNYNGEPRTNVTCIDARPVPYAEHGRAMLREVQEMLAAGASLA